MASQGQYVVITSFGNLPNQRCSAKDGNKAIRYRNNWCINKGECGACSIARQYERFLLGAKAGMTITHDEQLVVINRIAQSLRDKLDGAWCNCVYCEECPFYSGNHSMTENCMIHIVEENMIKSNHLL